MESLLWLPLRMELHSCRRGGRTVAPICFEYSLKMEGDSDEREDFDGNRKEQQD